MAGPQKNSLSGQDLEMIALIAERAATKGAEEALDNFMTRYELKAEHWVWIGSEYEKARASQSAVRKALIGFFVTSVALLSFNFLTVKAKTWMVTLLSGGIPPT